MESSTNDKTCSEDGCNERLVARGLCSKHYEHYRKRGTLPPLQTREKRIPPGTEFGNWTVIERAATGKHRYLCRCVCGVERTVLVGLLRSGRSTSCGCTSKQVVFPGERFERLEVIDCDGRSNTGQRTYSCQCDCGNTVSGVESWNLRSGNTKSCGCLRVEKAVGNDYAKRHGWYGTPTHRSWASALNRCTNPNSIDWDRYGGRGITFCDRWNPKSGGCFENFLADMGERPDDCRPSGTAEYSLDRINVNGNYEKSNCRWATIAQQQANRRPRLRIDVITEAAKSVLNPEQVEALLAALGEYPQTV